MRTHGGEEETARGPPEDAGSEAGPGCGDLCGPAATAARPARGSSAGTRKTKDRTQAEWIMDLLRKGSVPL